MQKILLVIVLFLMQFEISAQKNKIRFIQRTQREAGVTLSTNGKMTPLALSLNQYWGLGKKRKFQFGLGLRFTGAFGSRNLLYITAPAILTSGKTGPGVFFTNNIPQNIDTLELNGNTAIFSLNVPLALRLRVHKKWLVEFNIDLLGISAGPHLHGNIFFKEEDSPFYSRHQSTEAKPTRYNLLLISDNDIGSLNSELMVLFQVKKNTFIKAGFSFLFSEYTVSSPVNYINSIGTTVNTDRYRTKTLTFGIGANHIINRRNHDKKK